MILSGGENVRGEEVFRLGIRFSKGLSIWNLPEYPQQDSHGISSLIFREVPVCTISKNQIHFQSSSGLETLSDICPFPGLWEHNPYSPDCKLGTLWNSCDWATGTWAKPPRCQEAPVCGSSRDLSEGSSSFGTESARVPLYWGVQIKPPQNVPLWHADYFELKTIKAPKDSGKAYYLPLSA